MVDMLNEIVGTYLRGKFVSSVRNIRVVYSICSTSLQCNILDTNIFINYSAKGWSRVCVWERKFYVRKKIDN